MLHLTLSRRFRMNDRQLRYRRLPIDCFIDTLCSNTTSRRNNKCAQIFATADGWCRAFPMSKKSQAHKGLSLLLQREGAPNTMKWMWHRSKSWECSAANAASHAFGETDGTAYSMVQCRKGSNPRAKKGRRPTNGPIEDSQETMGHLFRTRSVRSLLDRP